MSCLRHRWDVALLAACAYTRRSQAAKRGMRNWSVVIAPGKQEETR